MLHATIDIFRVLDSRNTTGRCSIVISLGVAVLPLTVFLLRDKFFETKQPARDAPTPRVVRRGHRGFS